MLVRRIARPLLAAPFVYGGIAPCATRRPGSPPARPIVEKVAEQADKQLPVQVPRDVEQWVKADAAVKVGAGPLFALGRLPRLTALVLPASIVPTTLAGHRFWEADPTEALRAAHPTSSRTSACSAGCCSPPSTPRASRRSATAPAGPRTRPRTPPRRASRRPRSARPRRRSEGREEAGQEGRALSTPLPPAAALRGSPSSWSAPASPATACRRSARPPPSSTASDDDQLDLKIRTNTLKDLKGVGPKTAAVIVQAHKGEVPEYLAKLEEAYAELVPLADDVAEFRAALRGDLHVHSDWSDGGSPIREMAEAAMALGHEYMALTDHSPRLTVANGLTAERLEQQLDVVAALNEELAPFRILTGIECRHQRRRQPRPDRRAARPARRRRRQRALRPAGRLDGDDRADAHRGRQPAHRRPRALHRPAGHRPPAAQRHAAAAAGEPVRRRGGVPRLRRVRHRGRDQLPARAAGPPEAAALPRRRARLRVRHRHRRARARSAGLAGNGCGREREPGAPMPDRRRSARPAAEVLLPGPRQEPGPTRPQDQTTVRSGS